MTTSRKTASRRSVPALALEHDARLAARADARRRADAGELAEDRVGLGDLALQRDRDGPGVCDISWRSVSGVPVRDDLPLVDDEDPVADELDLGKDVRREEDRVVLPQVADQLADLHDLPRVEADRRLVEDEDLRLVDERAREADALPVALREVADRLRRDVVDEALLERLVDARLRRRVRGTPQSSARNATYSLTRISG